MFSNMVRVTDKPRIHNQSPSYKMISFSCLTTLPMPLSELSKAQERYKTYYNQRVNTIIEVEPEEYVFVHTRPNGARPSPRYESDDSLVNESIQSKLLPKSPEALMVFKGNDQNLAIFENGMDNNVLGEQIDRFSRCEQTPQSGTINTNSQLIPSRYRATENSSVTRY